MIRQQHLSSRDACLRFAAEVEHDLEEFPRIDSLVQRARKVRRQGARKKLDLLVPIDGAGVPFSAHPKESTSPFSRKCFDTRTASSLTSNNCVSKTLNPRPRRASIMCES